MEKEKKVIDEVVYDLMGIDYAVSHCNILIDYLTIHADDSDSDLWIEIQQEVTALKAYINARHSREADLPRESPFSEHGMCTDVEHELVVVIDYVQCRDLLGDMYKLFIGYLGNVEYKANLLRLAGDDWSYDDYYWSAGCLWHDRYYIVGYIV